MSKGTDIMQNKLKNPICIILSVFLLNHSAPIHHCPFCKHMGSRERRVQHHHRGGPLRLPGFVG